MPWEARCPVRRNPGSAGSVWLISLAALSASVIATYSATQGAQAAPAAPGGVHRVSVGGLHRADPAAREPVAGAHDAGAEGPADDRIQRLELRRVHPGDRSLCIPAMNLEDGPAGVADGMTDVTQLPAPVDVAATFDTSAEQSFGQVIGGEEAAKGTTVDLGPTINIVRDPRWGRAFESVGEDPYLNGADGRRRHPGRAVDRHDGAGQAPGRVQPGDQPQHPVGQRDRQRPDAAGDLRPGVPDLGAEGRRVVRDVLLQHHQRHLRLPEPDDPEHRAAPGSSASTASSPPTGAPRTPARASVNAGLDQDMPGDSTLLRQRPDIGGQLRPGVPGDDQHLRSPGS